MSDRDLARYYAGSRVVIGLLLFLFPSALLKGMLGQREVVPGLRLFGRLVGARDAILGAGAIAALQDDHPHAVRPWMVYGMAADAADAVAMAIAYRHLPKRRRFATVAMAVGGAAAGGYLMTRFDD